MLIQPRSRSPPNQGWEKIIVPFAVTATRGQPWRGNTMQDPCLGVGKEAAGAPASRQESGQLPLGLREGVIGGDRSAARPLAMVLKGPSAEKAAAVVRAEVLGHGLLALVLAGPHAMGMTMSITHA
ncbi:hypothetical protein llap_14171 [Limosa lapponica baueri]|uniref:Uncharacterized protein n=1 Tax=Limosa lapponica baueri TaxID=1758121 RepID=A0A2I0TNY1_LIMLA|nr:hypothetical protein llap_14171 [Limosa lapponica baueri]